MNDDVKNVRSIVEQALNDAGYPTHRGADDCVIVYDQNDDAAIARLSVCPVNTI